MFQKKQPKFTSVESLQPIGERVNEAAKLIQEEEKRFDAQHPALATFKKITRKMALFTFSPTLLIGLEISSAHKQKLLREDKKSLLQEAVEKQHAIIEALQKEVAETREEAEHLQKLNEELQKYIEELRADLEIEVA